eukprot:CAMPEP_0117439496 /NCGR_PEP_ID=MMETSP0759-20121206/2594_1 /TAXON_ID=63605 /ORGANISM="Percolomonas cosmopolitus, Strain WS" /LENGTH=477 /DNA_ID=CAMNT_0005231211 /DNA_START=577 /DNA_END=2010 /DNA_ORIENTATION=-
MKQNLLTYPDIKWQYIASEYGATQMYPAHRPLYRTKSGTTCQYPQDQCATFDARLFDWYAAYPPPNNVILLLDKSGSMKESDRMAQLKESARLILAELTFRDRVAIVFFDDKPHICDENIQSDGTTTMLSGIPENHEALRSCLDRTEASGESDFGAAFEAAFNVLEHEQGTENFACISSILFFTDGRGNAGSNPLDLILRHKPEIDVRIFTFVFGSAIDSYNMQSIACEAGGLSFTLRENVNLRSQMTKYHQLLGHDRKNFKKVLWSLPREMDELGEVVSASLACHSDEGALLGMAAVDVPLSSFAQFDNWRQTLDGLQNKSELCLDARPTDAYVRWLRGGACNYCDPSLCGAALHAFIGIASVSGVLLISGTVLIFLYVIFLNIKKLKRKYQLKRKRDDHSTEELISKNSRNFKDESTDGRTVEPQRTHSRIQATQTEEMWHDDEELVSASSTEGDQEIELEGISLNASNDALSVS